MRWWVVSAVVAGILLWWLTKSPEEVPVVVPALPSPMALGGAAPTPVVHGAAGAVPKVQARPEARVGRDPDEIERQAAELLGDLEGARADVRLQELAAERGWTEEQEEALLRLIRRVERARSERFDAWFEAPDRLEALREEMVEVLDQAEAEVVEWVGEEEAVHFFEEAGFGALGPLDPDVEVP